MNFYCPVCLSKSFSYKIKSKDFCISNEEFNIVSCDSCGLWQTYPYPEKEKIEKYYISRDYISHSDKKEGFLDIVYHLVRKYTIFQKIKLVKKYVPRGTILDFGCGTGYFLENCKKNDFIAYGIEPSKLAREKAISKGLFVKETLNYFFEKKISFDVITLWHVLEHLYLPNEYINKFHQILKNKSYLIIALPNRNSYDCNYYKEYWAGYDVPRHLFHFTKKDIIQLTKDKFNLIKILPMYFDSFYVSILSEKYKKSNFYILKGLKTGFISNIKALKNNEYSSLIYVLQKN